MGYTFQSTYGELAKVYRFGTTLGDVNAILAYLDDFSMGVSLHIRHSLGRCVVGMLDPNP
jgi:hypothetical protein